ncbi:hypothetical protein RHS01_03693 [Rhizoctonia solani]|uniref:Transmembrane protein n=1 Tax=Rhizoctonia solani TaxID=456999 RepID=A0A8H7M6L0_9AGAM|nr:hypothetical protein RHS01_03693 [Rhizoctonia solani]
MSEEHVQFPLVIQQRKTESISTFPNGSGDHPPPAPNGVNIQTPTGSQTPTSTEINGLEDRPIINGTAAALVIDGENGIVISAPAPAGPPPPYSEEPRRSRRPTLVSAHSDDDEDDEDDGDRDDAEEGTPLLHNRPRRRSRAASYSTMASYTGVDFLSLVLGTQPSTTSDHTPRLSVNVGQDILYLFAVECIGALWLHLAVINFPFALAAWVLLFCGVVLGTTLLITLPFGVVFWFLTLFLSRSFARAEVSTGVIDDKEKRTKPGCTAPSAVQISSATSRCSCRPSRPIFYRPRPPEDIERALTEPGTEVDVDPTTETSFLKNSYSMVCILSALIPAPFTQFDGIAVYGPFVVSTTLLLPSHQGKHHTCCHATCIGTRACLYYSRSAGPAMLRIVRRIGAWQANLAIEALS